MGLDGVMRNTVDFLSFGFKTPCAVRNMYAKPIGLFQDWVCYLGYKVPNRTAILFDHIKIFKDLVGGMAILKEGLEWANRGIDWYQKKPVKYPWVAGEHIVATGGIEQKLKAALDDFKKEEITYSEIVRYKTDPQFRKSVYFTGLGFKLWEGLEYFKNIQLIKFSDKAQKRLSWFGTSMGLLATGLGLITEYRFVQSFAHRESMKKLSREEIRASRARQVACLAGFALSGMYAPVFEPHRFGLPKKWTYTVFTVAGLVELYFRSQIEAQSKAKTN